MKTHCVVFDNRYTKVAGFTLIELLVVLALLAILLTLTISSERHLFIQNRTTTQVNTLVSALYYARNEAVFRNKKLIFCKSADQKNCGGKWRDGQILIDDTKSVLRVFPPLSEKNNLIWNGSFGRDDAIAWLPTGYTNGQHGTFFYCSDDLNNSRSVVLWDTGRVYVSSMGVEDYVSYCQ